MCSTYFVSAVILKFFLQKHLCVHTPAEATVFYGGLSVSQSTKTKGSKPIDEIFDLTIGQFLFQIAEEMIYFHVFFR